LISVAGLALVLGLVAFAAAGAQAADAAQVQKGEISPSQKPVGEMDPAQKPAENSKQVGTKSETETEILERQRLLRMGEALKRLRMREALRLLRLRGAMGRR